MTLRILLPYPPPILSPNARAHWTKRSRSVKKYRAEAMLLTINALNEGAGRLPAREGKLDVRLVFRPAVNRSRDLDNCIASVKAALDGIADALGVNDTRFRLTAEIGETASPAVVEVTL